MKLTADRKLLSFLNKLPVNFRKRYFLLTVLAILLVALDLFAVLGLYKVLGAILSGIQTGSIFLSPFDTILEQLNPSEKLLLLFTIFLFKNGITALLFHVLISGSYDIAGYWAKRKMERQLQLNPLQNPEKTSYASINEVIMVCMQSGDQLILPSLLLISEAVLFILAMILAAIGHWKVLVFLLLTIVPTTLLILRLTRKNLHRMGELSNATNPKLQQLVDMSVLAYPEITLHNQAKWVLNAFEAQKETAYKAKEHIYSLSGVIPPRILETAVVFSLFLMVWLMQRINQTDLISPLIILFSVLSFRLMPSVNRIIRSYHSLKTASFLYDFLPDSVEPPSLTDLADSCTFQQKVELKNICFGYDRTALLLNDVTIKIQKGSLTGLTGESGSGKSTLAGILCGLLPFHSGNLLVDDVNLDPDKHTPWQQCIGLVRQETYLFPGTIRENICFGLNSDELRLWEVARTANIDDWIKSLPNGLDTEVGQLGNRISGGQKQRISIARALYKNPSVLVLDEATNALDSDSRRRIMTSLLEKKDKMAILVISHDTQMLDYCSEVYRLENSNIHFAHS